MAEFTTDVWKAVDKDAWMALWADYSHDPESIGLDLTVAESNWKAIVSQDGRIYALALFDQLGKAVGFTHYVFHHSTKYALPECYLIDLFVHQDARGQGGGRMLVDAVIADCEQRGMARVTWITRKENTDAQRLYESFAQGTERIRYVVITDQ